MIISILLSLDLQAQVVSKTVNVQTAGTLSSLIPATDKYQITNLTVTGYLNGTDIRYIREMAGSDVNGNSTLGKLSVLDLSGANIVAGGSSYYSNYTTSLNEIWDFAFNYCTELTSITIPNSVTSIGVGAFYGCTELTSIIIADGITSIGSFAFYGCTGLTSIVIPGSVTSIENFAFCGCTGLTSIIIADGITSIGSSAFNGCTGLTSIVIPGSVTSIETDVFDGCIGLKKIIVSESNTVYNSVEGVLFSKDCTELIAYPNAKSNIYTLPNSVTSIGEAAFYGCTGLTSIVIPNGVTSIGDYAFSGSTKLKEFIVSENNPVYSSVEGVLFSKGCTKLIAYPNAKSNIYILPNSVTFIGDAAFLRCTELTSITIPSYVTFIGEAAFSGCTGITEIHCKMQTPPNIGFYVFTGINEFTCKLYIPKGTYSNYLGAIGWSDFTNIIEEEATAISQTEKSNVKVYTDQDAITVTGADLGDNISVYTESGALLQTIKVTDNTIRITVPGNKIYFIRTAGKVFKVAL